MIKSFNGITSLVLGIGLIASNFITLGILAKKDQGIPNIAALPNTPYSSFSIRSEKVGKDHKWSMNSRQHDPKVLLTYSDVDKPGFKGRTTQYKHNETVAHTGYVPKPENMSAKQLECLEKNAQARSNGAMVGVGVASAATPAISQVPIIGWLLSGLAVGQAKKTGENLAQDVATDWNDC